MFNRFQNARVTVSAAAGLLVLTIAGSASAAVIRVKSSSPVLGDGASWATAMPHLKDALAVAQAGDEIWVASGTYYPDTSGANPGGTGDRTSRFVIPNGVRVLGGFTGSETIASDRNPSANLTVLSGDLGIKGDLNISDNAYGILYSANSDSSTLLDGFKIRKSNGDNNAATLNFNGGGIYLVNSTMVINNCHFDYLRVNLRGGAIAMEPGSAPTITNCLFTFCYGWNGGCIQFDTCNPVIEDCVFQNNTAGYGAAISGNIYSGGRVSRCTFVAGHGVNGGAISMAGFSTTHFDRCLFRKNRCEYLNAGQQRWNGGAVNNWCAGTLWTNCVFVGNTTNGNGGAFYDGGPSGTRPTLINCTIYGNYSRDGGAVAADPGHTPVIKNCIVWSNTAGGANAQSTVGSVTVENSNVQGLSVVAGSGNMSVDPQFVSPVGADGIVASGDEDFGLHATSPLIDAGDDELVTAGAAADFAGNARFIDGDFNGVRTIDIGALEFVPPPCFGDANGDRVINFADITDVLSNWQSTGPNGDADLSGFVNFADITTVLTLWGAGCGIPS